jgi:hypothetical protein
MGGRPGRAARPLDDREEPAVGIRRSQVKNKKSKRPAAKAAVTREEVLRRRAHDRSRPRAR